MALRPLAPLAKQIARTADSPLTELFDKLVVAEVKGPAAKRILAKLTGAAIKTVVKTAKAIADRLPKVVEEIIVLSKAIEQRHREFKHLFGEGLVKARSNPSRTGYLRLADEAKELVDSVEGREALKTDAVRKSAEALRNQLAANVAYPAFDRYADLSRETGALNKLINVLTPEDRPPSGYYFAAHHIIEARMYERYAAEWRQIGWANKTDMMATAIPWESHGGSSASKRGLPGFEERPEALISLSQRLQDAIPLDVKELDGSVKPKYKNATELINAYIEFYKQPIKYKRQGSPEAERIIGAEITNRIVEALKAVREELRQASGRADAGAKAAAAVKAGVVEPLK